MLESRALYHGNRLHPSEHLPTSLAIALRGKPPIPDPANCVKAIHAIVDAPIAATLYDHGDTADRPKPKPRMSNIKDKAVAATAPAKTAPHETPDACASAGEVTPQCMSHWYRRLHFHVTLLFCDMYRQLNDPFFRLWGSFPTLLYAYTFLPLGQ